MAPDMAPTNRPSLSSNWTSARASRHPARKVARPSAA